MRVSTSGSRGGVSSSSSSGGGVTVTIAPPDSISALQAGFADGGNGFGSEEDENAVHGESNASGSLVCLSPAPKYAMHHPGVLSYLVTTLWCPSSCRTILGGFTSWQLRLHVASTQVRTAPRWSALLPVQKPVVPSSMSQHPGFPRCVVALLLFGLYVAGFRV